MLYTIKEAAKILGYKEGTLRNKIFKNEIEAIKIGGKVRVSAKEIEAFTGLEIIDGKLIVK